MDFKALPNKTIVLYEDVKENISISFNKSHFTHIWFIKKAKRTKEHRVNFYKDYEETSVNNNILEKSLIIILKRR